MYIVAVISIVFWQVNLNKEINNIAHTATGNSRKFIPLVKMNKLFVK